MNQLFVRPLEEIDAPEVLELGGKGYSLAMLIRGGFSVPKGFVVVSRAFLEFLKTNDLEEKIRELSARISEDNFTEKSEEIRQLILLGQVPENIASEVKVGLNELSVEHVSVRSSGVGEDSRRASFAGLFDTFLSIRSEPALVVKKMKQCWGSVFSERAVFYRLRKGIPHLESIATVVQTMMPAEISGVTFTVHPSDKGSLLIESSYGIGDMIVGGRVGPDDYKVDRETLTVIDKRIGNKCRMSMIEDGEIRVVNVEREIAERQALSEEQITYIAKTCLEVERFFDYPQDVEWCILNDKLWLLQSRPITGAIK